MPISAGGRMVMTDLPGSGDGAEARPAASKMQPRHLGGKITVGSRRRTVVLPINGLCRVKSVGEGK
jgi:hypothetical protein